MATTFGTRPEDTVADSRGNVLSGVVLTLYPSKADAQARTSPVTTVSTNGSGLFPYDDPTGRVVLWARDPAGNVWAIESEGATAGDFTDQVNAAKAAAEDAAASAASAASLVNAPADSAIAAAITPGSGSASEAVLNSTVAAAVAPKADQSALDNVVNGTTVLPYLAQRGRFDDLPATYQIAHRGGGGVAPESTMAAFRNAVACGIPVLEMDVQNLADGRLAVIHDITVDRTTNRTGNVAGYSTPAFQTLDAAAKFPWNGRVEPPPFWDQVLNELGGKVLIAVEPKNPSIEDKLAQTIIDRGLQRSVIVEVNSPTMLAKFTGYGLLTCYWGDLTTQANIDAAIAGGADVLMLARTVADATISLCVASGKPVWVWDIHYRKDRDRALGLGAVGIMGDQPYYNSVSTNLGVFDSWRYGVLGHGYGAIPTNVAVAAGTLQLTHPTGYHYRSVGELSPVANAAGSYTITVEMGFDVLPTNMNTGVAIDFGNMYDGEFGHSSAGTFPNGYRVYLTANGSFFLDKITNGVGATAVQAGIGTVGLTAGNYASIQIDVTPTTISAKRTDAGGFATLSGNDTTYRGGYIQVGRNAVTGTAAFRNLTVA